MAEYVRVRSGPNDGLIIRLSAIESFNLSS